MNCRSFKDEFELLTQQHMRRSLSWSWRIAQKFARSHPPRHRFPLRWFVYLAKTEQQTWLVPSAIPSRARHATPRRSQPCRPIHSTRKRLPNRVPSAASPNRNQGNSHSEYSEDGLLDRRFAAPPKKSELRVRPIPPAMVFLALARPPRHGEAVDPSRQGGSANRDCLATSIPRLLPFPRSQQRFLSRVAAHFRARRRT